MQLRLVQVKPVFSWVFACMSVPQCGSFIRGLLYGGAPEGLLSARLAMGSLRESDFLPGPPWE